MRSLTILTLLALASLSLGMGRSSRFSISFHLEVDDETAGRKRAVPVKIGNDTYKVSRLPEITHRDFAGYRAFRGTDQVSYGAAFKLKPSAQRRLTAVSRTSQNKILFAKVNQSVVDEVRIDMPVTDGWIIIWKGITPDVKAELDKRYLKKKRKR